jgi:hypothetical protein
VGVELGELVEAFSELGKLVRSTRRKVENVRKQNDGAVLDGIGQTHRFLAADWQLEVGGAVADGEMGHTRFYFAPHVGHGSLRIDR